MPAWPWPMRCASRANWTKPFPTIAITFESGRRTSSGHASLADALLAKKDADGAMHEYEEAIRLQPDYPNAHYNLALTLEALGQFARARQEFEAYLQLAPNAPDAEQVRKHLKQVGAAQNKK